MGILGLFKIYGKEFADLLGHISPLAFKVIDWKPVIKGLSSASQDFFRQNAQEEWRKVVSHSLPDTVRFFDDEPKGTTAPNNGTEQQLLGQNILALYFTQLKFSRGFFVDLRKHHFLLRPPLTYWNPKGPIYIYQPLFRQGITSIYKGFYTDNQEELREGLRGVGLVPHSASKQQEDEVAALLFSHWGQGDQTEVRFNLSHFKQSFHNLFSYLKRHNIILSSDFLFLGLNLLTMYMALESTEKTYNVRKIFLQTIDSEPLHDTLPNR